MEHYQLPGGAAIARFAMLPENRLLMQQTELSPLRAGHADAPGAEIFFRQDPARTDN